MQLESLKPFTQYIVITVTCINDTGYLQWISVTNNIGMGMVPSIIWGYDRKFYFSS